MELVTWADLSTAEQIARELNGGATLEDVLSRYDAVQGEQGMILPRFESDGVARARSGRWVTVPAEFDLLCYVARRRLTVDTLRGEFDADKHQGALAARYFYIDPYGRMQFSIKGEREYDRICKRLLSL